MKSRGLGDVYKRQPFNEPVYAPNPMYNNTTIGMEIFVYTLNTEILERSVAWIMMSNKTIKNIFNLFI